MLNKIQNVEIHFEIRKSKWNPEIHVKSRNPIWNRNPREIQWISKSRTPRRAVADPSVHNAIQKISWQYSYHIKPQNDTIYCFLIRINASKLADQGRKYKIQLSPAEKSPWSVGFQRGPASAHAHYAWMLINWNGLEGWGWRNRNRSITWSGLIKN